MACGSCGGNKAPLRVQRVVATKPKKLVQVTAERLGTHKLTARISPTSVKPANNLDKHRA